MSVWSKTFSGVKDSIKVLYRRHTGKYPQYAEMQIIDDSVNEALHTLCMSRNIARWQFRPLEVSVACTSGQAYIDLPTGTISVLSNSVAIPASKVNIYPTSLEGIMTADPGSQDSGLPTLYAFDSTTDPDIPRLRLYPSPSEAYVVTMKTEAVVDEDSLSPFPSYLTGPITDLATAIAMRRLAFGDPRMYKGEYKESEGNIKNAMGDDGPMFIPRAGNLAVGGSSLESRIASE